MLKKLPLSRTLNHSQISCFSCTSAVIAELLHFYGIAYEPTFWDVLSLTYDSKNPFTEMSFRLKTYSSWEDLNRISDLCGFSFYRQDISSCDEMKALFFHNMEQEKLILCVGHIFACPYNEKAYEYDSTHISIIYGFDSINELVFIADPMMEKYDLKLSTQALFSYCDYFIVYSRQADFCYPNKQQLLYTSYDAMRQQIKNGGFFFSTLKFAQNLQNPLLLNSFLCQEHEESIRYAAVLQNCANLTQCYRFFLAYLPINNSAIEKALEDMSEKWSAIRLRLLKILASRKISLQVCEQLAHRAYDISLDQKMLFFHLQEEIKNAGCQNIRH